MKAMLLGAGVLAVVAGLLWAAQGAGYVTWPAESFMIGAPQWIYYGLATAIGGVALIAVSRR